MYTFLVVPTTHMKKILTIEIEMHNLFAQKYLRLASDNLAVVFAEDGSTATSRERQKEYIGYAEDYSLLAKNELSKAYAIAHENNK